MRINFVNEKWYAHTRNGTWGGMKGSRVFVLWQIFCSPHCLVYCLDSDVFIRPKIAKIEFFFWENEKSGDKQAMFRGWQWVMWMRVELVSCWFCSFTTAAIHKSELQEINISDLEINFEETPKLGWKDWKFNMLEGSDACYTVGVGSAWTQWIIC